MEKSVAHKVSMAELSKKEEKELIVWAATQTEPVEGVLEGVEGQEGEKIVLEGVVHEEKVLPQDKYYGIF